MKVLSLGGAGAVCQYTTRDLAEFSDFSEIVIGDVNVEAAEKLAADIGDPRLKVLRVDAEDYDGLVTTFKDFDIIVNGLPWRYDLAVTKALAPPT
jgi:saccharopine dehydrogenase-like NADP-dependent oxidoreductase